MICENCKGPDGRRRELGPGEFFANLCARCWMIVLVECFKRGIA